MKSTAEFSQGDVLKLADAFAGDSELYSNLLEGLALVPVETEARVDDFTLAFIEHIEQIPDLVAKIFVP